MIDPLQAYSLNGARRRASAGYKEENSRVSTRMPPTREDKILIVTTGSRTIRAVFGISELFQRPSLEIQTRVGVVVGQEPKQYLIDKELDAALLEPDSAAKLQIVWPLQNGKVIDWDAMAALW